MKAVFDTNVIISAIFYGGAPSKALAAWSQKKFELCYSPAILEEYIRVEREFAEGQPGAKGFAMLALVASEATSIPDRELSKKICRDPKDEKFLACAVSCGADFLVTGDKDLLVLGRPFEFPIVTPAAFLKIISPRISS